MKDLKSAFKKTEQKRTEKSLRYFFYTLILFFLIVAWVMAIEIQSFYNFNNTTDTFLLGFFSYFSISFFSISILILTVSIYLCKSKNKKKAADVISYIVVFLIVVVTLAFLIYILNLVFSFNSTFGSNPINLDIYNGSLYARTILPTGIVLVVLGFITSVIGILNLNYRIK